MVHVLNCITKLLWSLRCLGIPIYYVVTKFTNFYKASNKDHETSMWEKSRTEYDYIRNLVYEKDGNVNVFWFPKDFSQSRLGDRNTGSNACTLIALLLAHKCYTRKVRMWPHNENPINIHLVRAFIDSIVEGNEQHEKMQKGGHLVNVNLTVPEAIVAAGSQMRFISEWKSLVYMISLEDSLYHELNQNVKEWYNAPPPICGSDLYVVLITENRTVLIIFQEAMDTVTLIDSHQHLPYGAIAAQVSSRHLEGLCSWYSIMLKKLYGLNPDCYELSFLYFKCYNAGEMHLPLR